MLISETIIAKKATFFDNMHYLPSPINFTCNAIYTAIINRSGRMQYYKTIPGVSRERISRIEFCEVYNSQNILGVKPLQTHLGTSVFQMEFYI